jgi:hypothetical protein
VLNHAFDTVSDQSWVPSSVWRGLHFLEQQTFAQERADFLDDVPVMSATVLGLDILLQEPFIDLRMVSELVLGDVGATIQILRLIGREYAFIEERPGRMSDCIASLEVGVWFGALSARTFAGDREHSAMTAVWKHCRLVAQYAQLVAESLDGVSPENAYLVGLLHGIGVIPAVLGWPNCGRGGKDAGALFELEGTLPLFVLAALRSMNDSSFSSAWKFILTTAHELAGARTDIGTCALRSYSSMGLCAC